RAPRRSFDAPAWLASIKKKLCKRPPHLAGSKQHVELCVHAAALLAFTANKYPLAGCTCASTLSADLTKRYRRTGPAGASCTRGGEHPTTAELIHRKRLTMRRLETALGELD